MPSRPLGIVLIALYSAFTSVMSVFVSLLAVFGAALVQRASGWMGLLGFGVLAMGILMAAVTYGLWTRQAWAPRLTYVAYAISIPLGLIALFADTALGNLLLQITGIVVACVVIAYIRRPEVIGLFAPHDASSPPP